jgi:hypothetical protein
MPDEPAVDVHGERVDAKQLVSDEDRARVLRGLPAVARAMAERLLDTYWDFDSAALFTLKQYAWSCERLTRLLDAKKSDLAAIHKETVINLALRRALQLGGGAESEDA